MNKYLNSDTVTKMSSQLTAAQKAMIENKRLDALDRKRMKANQKLEKESLKSSIDKKVFSEIISNMEMKVKARRNVKASRDDE
jgi:hypothetical protein